MPKGPLPLVYLTCLTLVMNGVLWVLWSRTEASEVAGTMIKACDRLAKRVSRRRGGRPAPHPSPVEAA